MCVFIYAEEKPKSSPKKKAQTPKGKAEKSPAASPQKVTVVLSLNARVSNCPGNQPKTWKINCVLPVREESGNVMKSLNLGENLGNLEKRLSSGER